MLESYPWLSVVPPIIAIGIAIWFRQVYFALIVGIWSGTTILQDGNIIRGLAGQLQNGSVSLYDMVDSADMDE